MKFARLTPICFSVLALAVLEFSTGNVVGQGWVTLANGLGDVDAPIYDVDGITPLAGTAFLAQLYAAAPGNSLAPIGPATPFLTGSNAGYVVAIGGVQVPGVPAFSMALIQVVAWRASDGTTFAVANHLGGEVGASAILSIRLGCSGTPACLPADLVGLQSFSLYVVPEPSPAALAVLGLALLGPRARRRLAASSREPQQTGHHGPVQQP